MNKIRTVLIDDEPLALDVLEGLLMSFPQIEIVGKFNNPPEVLPALKELNPAVVFTDIQMPGQSGLDFIQSQYPSPFAVIFTTAHPNFAADAFEYEALDYLLKPISPDRLGKAIKRLEEYIEYRNNATEVASTIEDYVYVKVDGEHQKILFKDIYYIEAFADYVKIWISPTKRIVTLQTMRNMEAGLPQTNFVRVHRSFIIAIDKIKSIQNNAIILEGDIEVPIGKNYKDPISNLLSKKKF